MQFVLFARYEEIAQLKKSSLKTLESGGLEITFDQAKNYNKWDCKTSCIAKNQEAGFDQVQIIRSYVKELSGDESQWLFPDFKKGKKNGYDWTGWEKVLSSQC